MKSIKGLLTGAAVTLLLPFYAWAGPVNVNTANAETLSAELQGVGRTKAQAIVEYRKKHGPFQSAAELTEVKGIGMRTVEINRSNILLKAPKKLPK